MTGNEAVGSAFDMKKECWADINTAFKRDINMHFQSFGESARFTDITDIYAAGLYDPRSKLVHNSSHYVDDPADAGSALNVFTDPKRCAFRDAVEAAMDRSSIDVLVYPSWNAPPQRIGHEIITSNPGVSPNFWAPCVGLPAITVPMGFVGSLPAGLQMVGRLFAEQTLFKVAYAYEQATLHRKPPAGFGGAEPAAELARPLIPGRSMAEELARVAQIGSDLEPGQQELHAHPLFAEVGVLRHCHVCAPGCLQIGTNHCCSECDWAVCTVCLLEHRQTLSREAKRRRAEE